jgi:hypothetical protein
MRSRVGALGVGCAAAKCPMLGASGLTDCKCFGFGQYVERSMNERTRLPLVEGAEADAAAREPDDTAEPPPLDPAKSAVGNARFVGAAMKSLFESSDVSIKRDDETRVMSRAQDTLEALQRRHPGVKLQGPEADAAHAAPPADESPASENLGSPSVPSGPRVDMVLWLVLAAGLFAIAGWMIASGL